MKNVIKQIEQANGEEIEMLLKSVLKRYAKLYPDWEISTISLEKTGDRNQQLENMILLLENRKDRQ